MNYSPLTPMNTHPVCCEADIFLSVPPPPPPRGKKHLFPMKNLDSLPPMFLPLDHSVLGKRKNDSCFPKEQEKRGGDRALASLSNKETPMTLKARPMFQADMKIKFQDKILQNLMDEKKVGVLPKLPLYSPPETNMQLQETPTQLLSAAKKPRPKVTATQKSRGLSQDVKKNSTAVDAAMSSAKENDHPRRKPKRNSVGSRCA